ncbi:MAG: NAD(P)H-hydrate dehydratase [Clostridia bacterium]|nr:NAD(P)H-hydrate dehydratase [Clostridia bacterium]
MDLLLSPAQIKVAEESANATGLSYEAMMEAAGRGCADFILSRYSADKKVVVLVGKGKNGGDGFVIARRLFEAGREVAVVRAFACLSDPLSERMRKRLPPGVPVGIGPEAAIRLFADVGVIVDAVFGIGFAGELPPDVRKMLDAANEAKAARVAIDLPSGMAFRADVTLTMLCPKPAHVTKPGSYMCGEIRVVGIGFTPDPPAEPAYTLLPDTARAMLPARSFDANKGTFGNTLILAGAYRTPGAAVIAATGCLRAGSGLTTLAFPDVIYPAVTPQIPEAVLLPLKSDENGGVSAENIPELLEILPKFSSLVIGPGLGTGEGAVKTVSALLQAARCPVVLDADGINIAAAHMDMLNGNGSLVLTPHPGEMARLIGSTAAEVNENREEIAREFAKEHNVTLLLKGANTLVTSPDGRLYVNPTGTPAMARGGSGDLLAGVIGALNSQGLKPFEAACLGAYFHGLAGNVAEKRFGPYASDVTRIADALFQ